jgi:hypothetical protein
MVHPFMEAEKRDGHNVTDLGVIASGTSSELVAGSVLAGGPEVCGIRTGAG